jgi:hypothetical protein
MRYAFSEVRKTVIGLVGFAVAVLAAFLTIAASSIPNEWLPWVQVIVAVATSYGIFQVPNQPPPGHRRRPGVSEVADPVGDVGPSDVPPDVDAHYDPGP